MSDGLVTQEQRRDFEENGFVLFHRMISPEQVEELLVDYEKAVRGEVGLHRWDLKEGTGKLVQLAYPTKHIPHWREHAYFKGALAIATELLGDDTEFHDDQIIMKPPHYPAETPWHQDSSYWRHGAGFERGITCWLALSPASKENGAMQFIPGSHRGDLQEHYDVSSQSEVAGALETKVDTHRAVSPILEPGDATFHHARTLHYTGGNNTDQPRRGLVTHFWGKSGKKA